MVWRDFHGNKTHTHTSLIPHRQMSPLPTEPQQFADLEKQAAVAEKRLTELQKQVSQLQHNTEQKHTQFKTDLLAQLHHLRQTMVGERTEAERAIAMNDIVR